MPPGACFSGRVTLSVGMIRRALAVWIVSCLCGSVAAWAGHDPGDSTDVATAEGNGRRPTTTSTLASAAPEAKAPVLLPPVAAEPPTEATPTTVAATPSLPDDSALPPEPIELTEPGLWVVRSDGSEAIRLGEAGVGMWWAPGSDAFYRLTLNGPEQSELTRLGMDGSAAIVQLPDGPTPEGVRPRRFLEVDIAGAFLAFMWGADGPRTWTGTAIGGLDPSTAVELENGGGRPSVSTGGLVAVGGGGVLVYGPDGRLRYGPHDVGSAILLEGWSPDSARLMVRSNDSCVLEVATGVCTSDGIDLGNVQSADFAPDSARLVVETFEPGGDELRLWITSPGGAPRVLTTDGGRPSWDPTGEGIAFDRSPYRRQQPGTASVVVIDADGSNERTLLTTNRQVVRMVGWSPDGRWIAISM